MMMLILRLIVTWVICHCNNNLDLHFPGCLDSIFVCLTMSTTTHYCNYSRCVCVCAVMVPCLWPHNDDTNDMLMLAPVSSLSSCRPIRAVSSMKNSRRPTLAHKPCLWFSLQWHHTMKHQPRQSLISHDSVCLLFIAEIFCKERSYFDALSYKICCVSFVKAWNRMEESHFCWFGHVIVIIIIINPEVHCWIALLARRPQKKTSKCAQILTG